MKTKINTSKKLLITLWDILLQVAKVLGANALYKQEWEAYGMPVSALLAAILIASVIVHYLQTRKD